MFLDDTRYFDTYADVKNFMDKHFLRGSHFWYISGTYYLHHGEYSSPDFYIGKNKNGFYVWIKYFYYNGTFNAKKDGPMTNDYYGRLAIGF